MHGPEQLHGVVWPCKFLMGNYRGPTSNGHEDAPLQVAELLLGVAAPIIYWEQGHEWLFGDPVRHQVRGELYCPWLVFMLCFDIVEGTLLPSCHPSLLASLLAGHHGACRRSMIFLLLSHVALPVVRLLLAP
jgi:hypothetical protein